MIVRNAFISAGLQYYGGPVDALSERRRRYLLGNLTARTRRSVPGAGAASCCGATTANPGSA